MTWQSELAALIQETQAHADAVQAKIPKPIGSAKLSERAPAESSRPTQIEPMSLAASGSEAGGDQASGRKFQGCSGPDAAGTGRLLREDPCRCSPRSKDHLSAKGDLVGFRMQLRVDHHDWARALTYR